MERCVRCGRPLRGEDPIMMELSNTDGHYYLDKIPEGHVSQGGFPFGKQCAILESADTIIFLGKEVVKNQNYR